MVFESIVAELLNKVLGEYIQNLDCTQLKLSLWGGDVVLRDLLISEHALDVLDLPIKLEYGRLGKLILKIPFKDMWNGQIDAIVEELFILVVPTNQVQYDPEKESKAELEAKRAEIARVEKNKQLAAMKPHEELDDSMVEKLIARMIKNIHVEINRIHVRYEDHVTFKDHPFSVGFTLNRFALESCTDAWTTTGNLKDMHAIQQIFKLCTMDGFAVYLNTDIMQFSKQPTTDYLRLFADGIATMDHVPEGYQYMLGPINVKAKLKLNPKPETDGSNYTIPKVWLDLEMQKLRIGLAKRQYQTLLQMGEGLDQAKKAAPYRKYRPKLTSYRGHYKEWWRFAYICVLEETVRRCRRNWDWNHMKCHRDTCREYAKTYQTKLTAKKAMPETEEKLTECERKLDIFNLVRIRQQIEMEVERLAEKEKNLKAKRGWFGFLWGSPKEDDVEDLNSAAAIMRKFEEAMTPSEKEKLYRAIDYQENSAPAHYPETFEMVDTRFYLHGLQIIVSDNEKETPEVLDLQLNGVKAGFKMRPTSNGIFVTASITDMKLFGVKQADYVPSLFNSIENNSNDVLLAVSYEKNPLDKLCGDRIIVKSKSVHIVYDAQTIIELVKLLKVQNQSTLNQIQAAAAERLEGFKEMSALGLEYAIQKHSVLDIQVDMEASQLLLPHGGLYNGTESLIVINLGSLKIHSLEKPKSDMASATVKQLVSMGRSEEDILMHLRQHSYDQFALKIVNFQILVASSSEDWRGAISTVEQAMTILQPTTLEVQFHKCLVTDDPLLPKMRIIGHLPSLALNIADARLLKTIAIVQSIPLPEDENAQLERMPLAKSVSQLSLFKELTTVPNDKKKSPPPAVKQTTDLEAKFVMKEFTLTLLKQENEEVTPFVRLEVLQVEAEMLQRTFDQEIMLRLGGVQVKQYHEKGQVFLINTPMTSGSEEYLIVVQYVNVNKHSPEFTTRHGSVVKLLNLEFTKLDVLLHQEVIVNSLKFLSNIQDKMSAASTIPLQENGDRIATTRLPPLATIQEDTSFFIKDQLQKQKAKPSTPRRKKTIVECIDLKIKAKIASINIRMASDFRDISAFHIEGITAGYIMKTSYSQANVNLASVNIKDLNSTTIYKNIVSVEGSESLQIQAIMYNLEPTDTDKNNMSIKVVMGCHRVVFLNAFVIGVMNFLNNFQAAQLAIKEASAAAAEAAKTNIKDVQERAARIELAVKLKAPVIYVPMNSKSGHCLMLDMGNLTICNSFNKLEVTNEAGDSPIVDEMKIELQDLKMSRVLLNEENFVSKNEVLLLQPVSFTLLMKRNLSTAWFKSIPDIDMSGKLNTIELLLSQEDYATILRVLEENLGEAMEEPNQTQSVVRNTRKTMIEDTQKSTTKFEVEVLKEPEEGDDQNQKHIHTAIKFEFIMGSFVINLFTGGSKLLSTKSSPLHLPENGLAKFGLTHFAVKGRIFGDGLLATSILLMNCTLDDTRHSRQGSLVRIMERTTAIPTMDVTSSEEDTKPIRSMLDMTIRKGANDMFVDLRVFSFSIIVSVDYLLKIKEFFNVSSTNTTQNAVQSAQKGNLEMGSRTKKVAQPAANASSMLTVNLHVEKPDIILLEDMDDINSNCIVLNTELLLKVRMIGEHQVITGSVKDLSILTGIYNPTKRADWIYQVLRPCSISIAGSTPEGKGLHVDVCCTDVHISVSPGVIEILNKVLQKISTKEADEDEIVKSEPTHEGLWLVTPYEESEYWFLKTEVGVEALEDYLYDNSEDAVLYKPELAIVSAPVILLTLEAGVGNKTLPMLLFHVGFQSNVNDWSTKTMSVECTMSLIMAYYNSRLALWEPLIEPVETIQNGERVSSAWELKTKVQFNDLAPDSRGASAISPSCESEPDELINQSSRMSIDIVSSDNLEITVTKTCLDVLQQLGKAFSSAMESTDKTTTQKAAPYVLKNETGLGLVLDLESSNFKVIGDRSETTGDSAEETPHPYSEVMLESGASVELAPKVVKVDTQILDQLKVVSVKDKGQNKFFVTFKGISSKLEIPVLRADKRFFSLKYRKEGSEEWGVISDVIVENGSTIVTLRSVLQVHNHFSEPVSVYYMTKRGNEVECVGTVGPDERLNLPLDAVYTPMNIYWLFFSINGYMVSIEPFIWKDLQKTVSMTKLLKCESRSKQENKEPFYIQIIFMMIMVGCIFYYNEHIDLLLSTVDWRSKLSRFINNITPVCLSPFNSTPPKYLEAPLQAVGEIEQVYFENTSRHTMASTVYNIHLYPSVYLKNFLPIDIVIVLPGHTEEKLLKASTILQLPTIDPIQSSIVIKLPQYLEKDWSCKGEILANPAEFSVWSFESFDSAQKVVMDLGMHTALEHGSIIMALYCPFWMLNKTGLMLSYRKSSKGGKEHSSPVKSSEDHLNVLYHPETFKGPILFSFRSKAFFGKKKAMVRVEDGEWSDKFPIDVAGSKGVVVCKYNGLTYQIGVHNQLTYNSLTKQITFTPYFILINNADFLIECQEAQRPADPVTRVNPGECAALWPHSEGEKKMLRVMVGGQPEKTAPFIYTDVHTTLLKLDNKYGGINVDIQINEGGVYISLSPYGHGSCPALIINHTSHTINLWEKGSMNVRSIQSFNRMFYTWENPSGTRKLVWEDNNKKEIEDDLRKDNLGTFTMPDIEEEIFYVSFLDGIQRVLLFTTSLKVAEECQLAGDFEIIDQDITMSIHGVGVSLVNNLARVELLYMCIASSGIIWEIRKSNGSRWRPLTTREVCLIEEAHQKYVKELQVGREPAYRVMLEPKLEVDFAELKMLRPHRGYLRRTFQTGLWLQYRTSAHQVQLHAKINRLQIDNQLSECVFPVILAPVPPPKSVVQSSVLKPFAELSMVKRLLEHSTVQQFRYFKVLIQEFHIKVDIGFINAIMGFFEADEASEAEESKLFQLDMKLVDEPLLYHVNLITTAEQKNFFDLLHFSPLKIHISFSMTGSGGGPSAVPQVLNVLLQGIGVTLTDINDIVFKLAYFERDYIFMTHKQLISEASNHYVGQAIKQLYVLVLGLDVIGDPYGLVVGTMKGIEDLFYEPFQGAIQGPGEFAEGLLLGVRSMLGHTVGGMAGAVSKITGAMGKGLAALTFDKEYQRKRQEQLNKQPANLHEGLARSGKGLVMGVFDGVTGVVMKPISGAREDGVEGFFKGVGKGMVGLVTRPTAGVIDFASGSFGAVKRATELSEEVKRTRPPRFLLPDSLIRPYVREEAEGNKILFELEKGKYANTDIYFYHIYVNKDVLLLTDKRIAYLERNELFGGWKVDWAYPWQEIGDSPKLVDRGVQIFMKAGQKKMKLGNLFGGPDHSKIILIQDYNARQVLYNKIQEQINQLES
ncbi:vacuolar protein sorting-associated protein 13 isoform X2 [Venturia canescens]|uniref:vacuolar protein sorting-associated protein 13 isoform X2 n=1 Tax=Venturia canescens TaxID=32260 RepID=UPI001C9D27CC|nr:vacuolar protein sorting-associated protein 13 isoform X2 [Venturia canescens]